MTNPTQVITAPNAPTAMGLAVEGFNLTNPKHPVKTCPIEMVARYREERYEDADLKWDAAMILIKSAVSLYSAYRSLPAGHDVSECMLCFASKFLDDSFRYCEEVLGFSKPTLEVMTMSLPGGEEAWGYDL